MFTRVGQPTSLCHGAVCGERVREGTLPLVQLSADFQSLPAPPTNKLGTSGADSWVNGLMYILRPLGLSNKLSCEAGSFSCHLNPHRCFQRFEVLFPQAGALGCVVCLALQLFLPVYPHTNVDLPVLQPLPCPKSSPPGCPSPPLLLVWMNVFSLTPWLSEFHTARFSGSSGCFLFLNLLLSFFWLWKAAQYVYLASILAGSPLLYFYFVWICYMAHIIV